MWGLVCHPNELIGTETHALPETTAQMLTVAKCTHHATVVDLGIPYTAAVVDIARHENATVDTVTAPVVVHLIAIPRPPMQEGTVPTTINSEIMNPATSTNTGPWAFNVDSGPPL